MCQILVFLHLFFHPFSVSLKHSHPPSLPPSPLHTQFRFTPPSAVISGFLGLGLYDIMGACSKLLQVELESSLRSIEVNMYVRGKAGRAGRREGGREGG
jgi:hypothetical protein